jgi:hypothetical protein
MRVELRLFARARGARSHETNSILSGSALINSRDRKTRRKAHGIYSETDLFCQREEADACHFFCLETSYQGIAE